MSRKPKWLRALVWGLAGLGVVLLCAFGFLLYADHGYLKPEAERQLTKRLGRNVSIDGLMHLRIGNRLRIAVNGLHVASEPWTKEPHLLEVGHIRMTIDTLSLLAGPVRVEDLVIDDARVMLEQSDDGRVNWGLGAGAAPAENTATDGLPVVFQEVSVSDSRLDLDLPDLRQKLVVAIASLDQTFDAKGVVNTRLRGTINDTPLDYRGRLDNLPALLERRPVNARFDAEIGDIEFEGRVALDDIDEPARPSVDLKMSGPDFAYLAGLLKLKVQGNGPLAMRISLAPESEHMVFDVDGMIGHFRVKAAGSVDDLRKPRVVEAEIDSSGPNLANVARVFGREDVPEKPFVLVGHVANDGDDIVLRNLRAELGAAQLSATGRIRPGTQPSVDLELRSAAFDLREYLADLPVAPLALQAKLAPDGERMAFDINGDYGAWKLEARGKLDALAAPGDIESEIDAAGTNLAGLARLFDVDGLPAVPFRLRGRFGRKGERIDFHDTRVQAGKLDLQANGGLVPGSLPVLDLALRSADLDLGDFLRAPPRGRLDLQVGLVPRGERLAFDAKGALGGLKLEAAGSSDGLAPTGNFEADVDVAGPDLARAARLAGVEDLPARSFAFAGHVARRGERYVLTKTRARLGKLRLVASGSIVPAQRPTVDLQLESDGLDLSEYGAKLPAAPVAASVRLTPGQGDFGFELDGRFDQSQFKAAGSLDDPQAPRRIRADVEVRGPDLARLGRLFEVGNLPARPFAFQGRIDRQPDQTNFRDARVKLGEVEFQGSGSVRPGDIPQIELALRADTLQLSEYLPADPAPAGPVPATPKKPRTRVIPDTPLPFAALENLDLQLVAAAREAIAGPRRVSDLGLRARVADGALDVQRVHFTGERGAKFQGSFLMQPAAGQGHVRLRVDGQGLNLGLPAASKAEQQALPHYDLRAVLDGTGLTVRQLAATATGYVWLTSGKGRLRAGHMRVFTNDFLAQVLSTVNPFLKQDPYANIECAAMMAAVDHGRVTGEPGLVVQTDRLLVAARAKLDLGNETFDADIKTVPRKGLGVSLSNLVNPYIKIGGTLARPHLEIDKKSTLLEGGAAIATGGISILAKGMFDRVTVSADPCGDAAATARAWTEQIDRQFGGGPSDP